MWASAELTAIRAAEVVFHEDWAEVGGGWLRRGRRVRRGGHRGRRQGLRLGLGDTPEGDLVWGLPLQGDGVALQGARGRRSHRPDPRGFQSVHGLPGLQEEEQKFNDESFIACKSFDLKAVQANCEHCSWDFWKKSSRLLIW